MANILGRIFRSTSPQTHLRTADVFTIAIPTVSYVSRSEVEDKLSRELDRCDRMICVTGPSKSGKTVLVTKVLPKAQVVVGQVGVRREDIWAHLCNIHNIPLKKKNGSKQHVAGKAGVVKGGIEFDQHNETNADARNEFLTFIQNEGMIIFDDFHYFEQDAQQELLQGLKRLLHKRIAVVIVLTSYGEDSPILAETDILARVAFIRLPEWDDDDLQEILRKGFKALNVKVTSTDVNQLVRRSFGSPLVVQELGSFLCYSNNIRAKCESERAIKVGSGEAFVRRAIAEGALAGDKPTFMQLIIGRAAPRERKEYKLKSGGVGDVYFLVFSGLRAFDLSSPIPYEALNKWIRDNVVSSDRPQGAQITTALEGLKRTSRELVQEAQRQKRSRELPIEWRHDVRNIYINDPFLALYIKWADWGDEYRERLGQLKSAAHP